MRIKVTLTSSTEPHLSFEYQYKLAGLLYHLLGVGNEDLALRYHNSTNFKLFTFSWLLGTHRIVEDKIIFDKKVKWFVSSPSEEFIKAILSGLIKLGNIRIEKAEFKVSDVEILNEPKFKNKMTFRTLSPILVRGFKREKKNPHWDLSPSESQFYVNLRKNLIKKYMFVFGSQPNDDSFNILEIINPAQKRIKIKNEFYRGWMMGMEVDGNPELLKLAYQAGIGEKNSMGFGMLMESDYP